MKTLFVYLKARLSGNKITWTDAKFQANLIDSETLVSRLFDQTCEKFAHAHDVVKAFYHESKIAFATGVGQITTWCYKKMHSSAFCRFIYAVITRRRITGEYIFN